MCPQRRQIVTVRLRLDRNQLGQDAACLVSGGSIAPYLRRCSAPTAACGYDQGATDQDKGS